MQRRNFLISCIIIPIYKNLLILYNGLSEKTNDHTMSNEFLNLLEERKSQAVEASVWAAKIEKYFAVFSYLNSELMLNNHIEKLTHVGITSLTGSAEMIRKMTIDNLDMIDNNLKKVIQDVQELTDTFNAIEDVLNYKQGFFNKKTNSQIFIEFFNSEQENIRKKINNLNVKQHALVDAKKDLENSLDTLIHYYILLDKDVEFLKEAEKFLVEQGKPLYKKIFNDHAFDILNIKTDLLTQQQIIFQKYGALMLLLQNILNCHKNISYLTRTTNSCLFNLVELQQIISLSNTGSEETTSTAMQQVKQVIRDVTQNLKAISTRPFIQVVEA